MENHWNEKSIGDLGNIYSVTGNLYRPVCRAAYMSSEDCEGLNLSCLTNLEELHDQEWEAMARLKPTRILKACPTQTHKESHWLWAFKEIYLIVN